MHQHDRDRPDAVVERAPQRMFRRIKIQPLDEFAARADPLVDLDHAPQSRLGNSILRTKSFGRFW